MLPQVPHPIAQGEEDVFVRFVFIFRFDFFKTLFDFHWLRLPLYTGSTAAAASNVGLLTDDGNDTIESYWYILFNCCCFTSLLTFY